MPHAFNFRADFMDGTSLEQGDDQSKLIPPDSPEHSFTAFSDLLLLQKEGKVIAEFHLIGQGLDVFIDMRTGQFNVRVETGQDFNELCNRHIAGWVSGQDDPLPNGFSPKLIYYRNSSPENISGDQKPIPHLHCVGWEAGGVKNILGIRP